MEPPHHPETQPERQIPAQLQVARLPIPPVPLWPVPPDGRRYDAVRRGSLLPSFCQKPRHRHQPGGAGIELCPSREMGRLRQECRRQVAAAMPLAAPALPNGTLEPDGLWTRTYNGRTELTDSCVRPTAKLRNDHTNRPTCPL